MTIEVDLASGMLAAALYGNAIDRRIWLAVLPLAAALAVSLLLPAWFLEAGLGGQVAAALVLAFLWIRKA